MRTLRYCTLLLCALAMACTLAACGNKGELVRPGPTPQHGAG